MKGRSMDTRFAQSMCQNDTYTNYIYETSIKNYYKDIKYYLSTAYGECHVSAWKGDEIIVIHVIL